MDKVALIGSAHDAVIVYFSTRPIQIEYGRAPKVPPICLTAKNEDGLLKDRSFSQLKRREEITDGVLGKGRRSF